MKETYKFVPAKGTINVIKGILKRNRIQFVSQTGILKSTGINATLIEMNCSEAHFKKTLNDEVSIARMLHEEWREETPKELLGRCLDELHTGLNKMASRKMEAKDSAMK